MVRTSWLIASPRLRGRFVKLTTAAHRDSAKAMQQLPKAASATKSLPKAPYLAALPADTIHQIFEAEAHSPSKTLDMSTASLSILRRYKSSYNF